MSTKRKFAGRLYAGRLYAGSLFRGSAAPSGSPKYPSGGTLSRAGFRGTVFRAGLRGTIRAEG